MKVVLVGDFPINDKIQTGIEGVLVNLTNEFVDRNEIDLVLVSFSNSIYLDRYRNKCKIYTLDFRSSILQSRSKFNEIVKKEKPDIIHLQGVVPGILLFNKKNKNRFIVTQHAILSKERLQQVSLKKKIKFYIKEIVERIYLTKVANIVFISNYNKEVYLKNRTAPELNYVLIPNPVSKIFDSRSFNEALQKKNELYFVGEIKKRKGLYILLKALSEIKKQQINFKLHVIGGFKEKEYEKLIMQAVGTLGLEKNVLFCGWKSQSEILSYTKDIPIFVLPSFQETLPLSVAEAMTQEKLVIATDVGGTAEMISDNVSGFLFPAGDHKTLAAIIKIVLLHPDNHRDMAINAGRESVKYRAAAVADKTLDFYSDIIKSRVNTS
ncbi:glycosyltransferase family 4 protein [Muriicola sp. Z0-33]|uniref:glycosyltransferase family 4 protein n=1 Tax=Muriicola sp. Z0-33 TaxID=2816957 RepID=UPI0022371BD4|nr:glycosyltransferase family 4 protein [Muriicola sp. Z0-33]MCW5515669.1 glycosyltransferase family 4 protein [Muriicola sp. Z0-33]